MNSIALKIFLLLAPASLLLSACGHVLPQREADSLYMLLPAEPDTLNPITATDAYSRTIYGHILETLIERDRDTLEVIPMLAERWEISRDRLRFRFYLKKGVRWSDGVEFTADDVVFSFSKIKDPGVACAHLKVYYVDVRDCRKIDRYTVEFTYARPYYLALEFCGQIPIVPMHLFGDGTDFNTHKNNRIPVGTGPYRFYRWKTGSSVELERNENYRGAKPEIKRIIYKIIPEVNVALQMLKKGDLDVMGIRGIQWERQTVSEKFMKSFHKLEYYQPSYSYIGWNSVRPFFADRRVRLAMTHLVNRQALLDKLAFGHGRVVSGDFYIFSKNYDQNIKPWPYDPQKTRELLDEAGWIDHDNDGIRDKDGVPFSFTFTISSASKFAERLASIVKEDFSKIGINVNINRFEWAVFVQKLEKRDFDMVSLGWNLGYSGDPYQLWHSSQVKSGSNFCGFINPEADRIIEAARMEFDEEKRTAMYHRFHQILHQEQPYTFLFCPSELVVVSKRFSNVKVHVTGLHLEEWKVAERQ
jgi:peptide/nickel transport system substrate-binding protein